MAHHGKHRSSSATGRQLARVATAGTLAVGALAVAVPAYAAPAVPNINWEPVIACESGGRNINNSTYPASTASGFFQILDSTWRLYGGTQFSTRAIGATKAQQLTVANRIAARNPSLSDWLASKPCWANKGVFGPPLVPPPVVRPPVVTPPPPAVGSYVVRVGDTLSGIAAANHTSWQNLYAKNRAVVGADADLIFPGERLIL